MNNNFENPFADYGNIVRGERFIGRKESLKVIENRVLRPRESGNLAIIGEPRIGKSSLVHKAVIEQKSDLLDKKLFPIWINLGTYDRPSIFFRSLVTLCRDELESLNHLTDSIKKVAEKALEDELSWSEGYTRIQRFFEKIRQEGYRILIILDEFDHARNLFKGDISAFQGLRELSYRPEWRVTFITTSRRSIRDIELQTGAISTFDGIFHKHYLSMFLEVDLQAYFNKFSAIGIFLDDLSKERILFYCGGHPFLCEMLGYEIVENYREYGKFDVAMAAQNISQSFLDQYDRMVSLLQEDDSLNKLLQILFGPAIDVKQTDVDEFLRYGLIKPYQDKYLAFSQHFQIFLSLIERGLALWPLWSKTERILRQTITTKMIVEYGERWIEKLEKDYPKIKPIFDQCRESQQKEEKSFGSRASKNLIDFTYPRDLFAIIFTKWKNNFDSIFKQDSNYWDQRAQLLGKIRNPLAHNRDEVLHDYERQIAEGYCKEILSLLNAPLQ